MRDFVDGSSVFYLREDVFNDYSEYKEDFKRVIKEREKRRFTFCHQSPQIDYRSSLVRYQRKICKSKGLSHSCLHLSVYLLDVFMDNHNIVPNRLLLTANVCLLLAAKLEENMQNVPKIADLNALVTNNYTREDYKNLEILIVQFFCFSIRIPCAVHYVFYFMQEFLSADDLNGERGFRALFFELRSRLCVYLDRVVDNVHFMQYYRPSKLAAALIAASRKDVGLATWNEQLERFTDYREEQLNDLLQILAKNNIVRCNKCSLE